jgi:ribosomal protein S18 acetylase RimI-like enzyme
MSFAQRPSIHVRDAELADAEAIAAIGQIAFPELHRQVLDPAMIELIVTETYSVAALRDCIARCARSDGAHFLLAERAGESVGYLHYDSEGSQPQLHRIYVDPDQKRTGVGGALLREHHARLVPGSSYILLVFEANESAIAFYRAHGLEEHTRVDAFEFASKQMGAVFPPDTPALPSLVLRFTSGDASV